MKSIAFIVLITVVLTGLFIWFSSNHNQNNDFTTPFLLSVLFALGFDIVTELQKRKIVIATAIGVTLAFIVKIIIDWQFDPTSHNLFPFEIVIDFIIASIASLIGVAFGYIYRRFRRRKLF